MGKGWDGGGAAFTPELWMEVRRVLKPGGYLLAFGGTRTYHRLTSAIEDAGFEIRDTVTWLHGQGFPKSKSCLKPGHEPIVLAKAPGPLLPLEIDAGRIGTDTIKSGGHLPGKASFGSAVRDSTGSHIWNGREATEHSGRWPANVALSHHDDCNGTCHPDCPVAMLGAQSGESGSGKRVVGGPPRANRGEMAGRYNSEAARDRRSAVMSIGDTGTAARFYYTAKASKADRGEGNRHPTVKSTDLMGWLIRLVTPPGGIVLDPFMGSGSTGKAAVRERMGFVGIEAEAEYHAIASRRIEAELAKAPLLDAPSPATTARQSVPSQREMFG